MYFNCPCSYSEEISKEEEIISHIDKCIPFNQDSPLCAMFNKCNPNKALLEHLLTFQYDLKLQVERIEKELQHRGYQKHSDSVLKNLSFDFYSRYTSTTKTNGKYQNGNLQKEENIKKIIIENTPPLHSPIIHQEDIKDQNNHKLEQRIDNLTLFQPTLAQMSVEEQPKQIEDQKILCEQCRKPYYFNKDFDKIWYLEQCSHVICKPCISKLMIEKYIQNDGKLLCPEISCNAKLTSFELKQIIGDEKFAELDRKLALKNQNIVECIKCKSQFSFEKGNPNEQVKDQNGKNITGEALINYANNRYICKNCKTEQCKECNSIPFHVGLTCQEHKKNQQSNKCILCETPCQGEICNQEDCQRRILKLCHKALPCGHYCSGVKNEECFCLECQQNQTPDDYCNMCFTEALKSAPCVITKCGHIFHEECILKRLQAKWNGPRIVFTYCTCPLCKKWLEINNKAINYQIDQVVVLKLQVQELCNERLEIEDMKKAKELTDPQSQFFNKPTEFAMDKFCFYECFKCKKPYFGGVKNCQAQAENQERQFNKEDLICPSCCPISFEAKCGKHGVKYIEFKCRFCCSVAVWFCGGTTHYCEPCHSGRNPNMNKPCPGPEKCPLGIKHKPTGQENALGCALCRSKRVDDILKKNN